MKPTMLSGLLLDVWSDLDDPGLLWQLLTLLLCLAAGSVVAGVVRSRLNRKQEQDSRSGVVRLGVDSFSRVLSPLMALLLLALAKPLLAPWHHTNVLRLFIPLLASLVTIRLAFYVLRRIFARSGPVGAFLPVIDKLFSAVVWIGLVLYITGLWPDLLQFLDDTVVPIGAHKVSLLAIVQACLSVAVTLVIALWVGALLEERLMRIETMHSSLRAVMARMARAALILIAVLVSLSLVGIDLTVLSVFGGAFGVGLGLGLQKIASSYVSGFVILLERSLSIGDLVAVDKYYGVVSKINTRYTVLQGMDGVESVVPNDILISNSVQNYSLTDSTIHLSTTLTVGYQTDLELVLRLLEEATASVARVSTAPPPQALFIKFGNNGLDLEVGFWIADVKSGRSGVISDVNCAIWKMLQEHHVELSSPNVT